MEMNRRAFLKGSALVGAMGAAALGMTACSQEPKMANTGESTEVQAATDWLGSAPEIDEADIANTIDVDVLVCGVGTGGVVAAGKAATEGLKVLAIDKGSMTDVKTAIGSLGNKYQKAAGVEFDKQAIVSDMERYAISGTDRRILNAWADRSGEAVDFFASYMERMGTTVLANSADSYQRGYYEVWPIEIGVPSDMPMDEYAMCFAEGTQALLEDIAACGSEVRYSTALVRLEQNDVGAVVGAIIKEEDGTYSRVHAAKGVILATGGYASNEEMLRALQPETLEMLGMYQMTSQVHGDGIRAGLWAGGVMQDAHVSMVFDRAAIAPDAVAGPDTVGAGEYFSLASQPWLKVNLNGERFMNESALYESAPRAALNQPGNCYCVLFDANWATQAPQFDTHGCSRFYPYPDCDIHPAGDAMAVEMMLQGLIESGKVVQADSIAELAQKLNVPADSLEATVARYNELCAAGVDEDFGKEAFRMLALDTAPYYGFRCAGSLLCTMDGLLITDKAEVVNEQGEPIEGLYAIGNDAGGFYSTCYPSLHIGVNAGRCMTFGFIAAEELAKK